MRGAGTGLGTTLIEQSCNTQPCEGSWSCWSQWSQCSHSGLRSRERSCEAHGHGHSGATAVCSGGEARQEQDCSAEGTWGNQSPHFGYNLPRLGAHGRKLAEQEFFRRMLAWRLEIRVLEITKSPLEAPKSRPGGSKIDPEPSKTPFFKTSSLRV